VVIYPTDRTLLDLSPRDFFEQIVVRQLAARGLVEGPNFFFGHDRAGDIRTLDGFCVAAGMSLDVVEPLSVGDQLVSSSVIRRLVQAGDVQAASRLLGAPYRLRGRVAQGAQRGRTLGFPTANLEEVRTVLPCDGVYAGRARAGEAWYAAGINVGPNPTFAEQEHKFEVHLIDFQGDLYGRALDVELLARLRDTTPFSSLEALRQQLAHDMTQVRALSGSGTGTLRQGRLA
jgi:riboflavin kinase/FMN adenylyltransferase